MPEKETLERAERDKEQGKSPSTQAGEFVREEMHHVREGKHGARSPQQAVAIGLSKARRAGVKLAAPKRGRSAAKIRKQARRDLAKGRSRNRRTSRTRSRATSGALRHERRSSASVRTVASNAQCCPPARTCFAAPCRNESGPYQGSQGPTPSGTKGGTLACSREALNHLSRNTPSTALSL